MRFLSLVRESQKPGRIGGIIRVAKRTHYVVLDKRTVEDNGLSYELLGFLVYLLRLPDDWELRPEVIARERGKSVATIYRLINGLIGAGYLTRDVETVRIDGGKYRSRVVYEVHELKIKQKIEPYRDAMRRVGRGAGVPDSKIPF